MENLFPALISFGHNFMILFAKVAETSLPFVIVTIVGIALSIVTRACKKIFLVGF